MTVSLEDLKREADKLNRAVAEMSKKLGKEPQKPKRPSARRVPPQVAGSLNLTKFKPVRAEDDECACSYHETDLFAVHQARR
jgi:hypothetical protein